LPPDAVLHCRVMFASDARRGTPWEILTPDQIQDFVRLLRADAGADSVTGSAARYSACIASRRWPGARR